MSVVEPRRIVFFQVLNVVGFVVFISVNMLANALPLNGRYTGELSDLYPNLFVPAGITFAIWGVIYLLFLLFVVYQARQEHRLSGFFLERIGLFFFISCIANAAWLFAWHYENVFAALVIMLVLLASLIMVYLRLDIGLSRPSVQERRYVHIPFSIYLGWITVATIANVTAFLVSIGWGGLGLGEVFWTVLVISAATLIASVVLFTRRDLFFAAVPVWAFLGIVVKRTSATPLYWGVALAALAGMIIICMVGLACRRLE